MRFSAGIPQVHTILAVVEIDQQHIDKRLLTLSQNKSKKPYQRQKGSLHRQLESFLWSQQNRKSIAVASPQDVINFLIWRDKFGKSVSHSDECRLSSATGESSCPCNRGLAAGTIDNNIGKL